MRFIRYIFFCLALILWVACGSDKGIKEILSDADSLVQSNPDSAFTLLESVEELDVLSDDVFAEWCLSNANVRDLLMKDPLSINYMSRAFNYFKESGWFSSWCDLYQIQFCFLCQLESVSCRHNS